MNVKDYIAHETERQSGTMTEAIGMYQAWFQFRGIWNSGYRLNGTYVLSAANYINGISTHRKVPAVFNQGVPAVPPGAQLNRAMVRWYEVLNSSQVDVKSRDAMFDNPRDIADFMTREFLLIHPFTDGNGRVGSLVWNFLNETIESPEPMPYFFGDN